MPGEFYPSSGGNSSVELSRTSRGEYSWGIKLYFIGNSMTTIKRMIKNVHKTKMIIESVIGVPVQTDEETKAFLEQLKTQADKKRAAPKSKKPEKATLAKPEGQSNIE